MNPFDLPKAAAGPLTGTAASVAPAGRVTGRKVYALAGMPFDALDIDQALRLIERAVQQRQRLFISTPNSNFAAAAQKDPAFRRSVLMSDLVVPDGMPLVYFAKLQGLPVQGRITGADLFERLLSGARCPIKVFFYGGPPGAAEAACARVNKLGGPLTAVGFESPGYGSVEELSDPETIARINACQPDFVVVALGAAKGQAWIVRNRDRLCAPVLSHLGAVVNFTAGSVRRAPRWVQAVNAEWLWRIYQEPVLWRRYWNDGLALLGIFRTQVLPNVFPAWQRQRPPGEHGAPNSQPAPSAQRAGSQASLHARVRSDGVLEVLMSGDWRHADLSRLSGYLQAAIDEGRRIEIEAAQLEDLGPLAIGLLMLVQVRVPSLQIKEASQELATQLRSHGAADFLAP